ncbi:MAG: secondary thiamine-phosphate synthase enzyme YjbQ [Nitrospirota bacterium]
MIKHLDVSTKSSIEFVDITSQVQDSIRDSGVKSGICYIFVPHTTAGITINEGADPSVVKDIEGMLSKLIPFNGGYYHREGNSAAHIKSSVIGVSETVLIDEGRLLLGTWQSIYFCEFDGPRHRRVILRILRD